MLIVVYHNFPFLQQHFFFATLAMDIFFVLSGFLITDILMNSFGKENQLRNFYVRRILRVFPLYYSALAVFFFILPYIHGLPVQIDYFVNNQQWFWFFLQNWLLIFHPNNSQFFLNHLWSIAVEEQFYLLWPLLVFFIKKPKPLLWFLIILFVCFSAVRFTLWVKQIEHLQYFSLYSFTRIDGICIGCMVALMQKIDRSWIRKNTGVIVLFFAIYNFVFYYINRLHNDRFPYLALAGFSTFSMIFGLIVYDIVNRHTKIISAAFDLSFLKFIGRISYGTYIIHWPLYLLLSPSLIKWGQLYFNGTVTMVLVSVLVTILSFFLGYLSYTYFEMNFLRLKKYFK